MPAPTRMLLSVPKGSRGGETIKFDTERYGSLYVIVPQDLVEGHPFEVDVIEPDPVQVAIHRRFRSLAALSLSVALFASVTAGTGTSWKQRRLRLPGEALEWNSSAGAMSEVIRLESNLDAVHPISPLFSAAPRYAAHQTHTLVLLPAQALTSDRAGLSRTTGSSPSSRRPWHSSSSDPQATTGSR